MTRRLLLMAAGAALALSLAACGSDDKSPTVVPTPTPPTRAEITMRLDPSPVRANYEGGGWYRFKVNMEFVESAGVGATLTNINFTVASAASGIVVFTGNAPRADRVEANGRNVLQFTMPQYHMEGGSSAALATFVASFRDDRGNALTATTQVNVLHHGEPHRLP